jgi:Domain of unknown function (DUF4189)
MMIKYAIVGNMVRGGVGVAMTVSSLIAAVPAARADCMHSCMADKFCGIEQETGRDGDSYCQMSRSECSSQCAGQGDSDNGPRDAFGALAYSTSTGSSGWAYSYGDEASARHAALNNCATKASDCQIVQSFVNACAAVSSDDNHAASAQGGSRAQAEAAAIAMCKRMGGGDCQTDGWACSFP